MKNQRLLYAFAGLIIMLFSGLVYAWSVLSAPIKLDFPTWSAGQLSLTFTICMMFFCIGSLAAGMISKTFTVRLNFYLSALLFAVGFYLASQADSLYILYIGYGLCCGTASGLAYNSVMGTIIKWFPDKQGTISGILLMGFGFGSMIIGSVYTLLTPTGTGGWRSSFTYMGFILAAVIILGSFFIKTPSSDQEKSADPSKKILAVRTSALTPMQMLKRPSFWLFFCWTTLLSAAGLALISQATPFAQEIGAAYTASTIAFVVGLISIANGVGRVFFGSLFDILGRKRTMLIITISFIVSVGILVISIITASFPLVVAGFTCTGLSYGGITPTNSAYVRSFYGAGNYPINFSIVNMNLLIASFGGTLAGILYDMSGSYLNTFLTMIAAGLISLVCLFAIKKP